MITVVIDAMTPCLKDAISGELIDTEVIQIVRKSFLKKYNKKNGWYVNWAELLDDNEVYALVVEGSVDIQGLVALRKDDETKSVYIAWMCTGPENNKLIVETPKYIGVGGHLFAIAADKSKQYGYEGFLHGYAANETLMNHYIKELRAEYLPSLNHPYHIVVNELSAKEIMEVYDFEWTDEKI